MSENLQALQSQLSANHRRVLSVRLRVLEDSCLRLLELFRARESSMTVRTPLPQEKAEEITRLASDLVAKIGQLKTDLNLQQASVDARREAMALVSAMSIDLEELQPRFLKGYGKVPPLVADYLNRKVPECLDVMSRMNRELTVPSGARAQKGK